MSMLSLKLIPIARVYASDQDAKSAVEALGNAGFDEQDISLITPSMIQTAASSSGRGDDIQQLAQLVDAAHESAEVPATHAAVYAEQLKQGRSLVMVTPPFGRALSATQTLDKAGSSVDFGELPALEYHTWMQPAPLSAALRLPLLSERRSWMSRAFPELKRDFLPTRNWFGGLLSNNPTPLSSLIGLKTISRDNPEPLSSKIGLKTISRDNPTPLSSMTGLQLLSSTRSSQKTSSFGMSLLSGNNPTPLSSALGLPLLSKRKSFTNPNVTLEKGTSARGETLPRE